LEKRDTPSLKDAKREKRCQGGTERRKRAFFHGGGRKDEGVSIQTLDRTIFQERKCSSDPRDQKGREPLQFDARSGRGSEVRGAVA